MPTLDAQIKGRAVKTARANERFQIILSASANGQTIQEAAKAVGLTVTGVVSMLYRNTRSTKWPVTQTTVSSE